MSAESDHATVNAQPQPSGQTRHSPVAGLDALQSRVGANDDDGCQRLLEILAEIAIESLSIDED